MRHFTQSGPQRPATPAEAMNLAQWAWQCWDDLNPAVQAVNQWYEQDVARRSKNVPDTVPYLVEGFIRYGRMGNWALEAMQRHKLAMEACETAAAFAQQRAEASRAAGYNPYQPALDAEAAQIAAEWNRLMENWQISVNNGKVASSNWDRLCLRMSAFYGQPDSGSPAPPRVIPVEGDDGE